MQLLISDRAVKDLEDIWIYTAQFSEANADRLLDNLYDRFRSLTAMPELGRIRNDLLPNLRSIVEDKHTIFYLNQPEQIEIVRVLHNRRDFKRQLRE